MLCAVSMSPQTPLNRETLETELNVRQIMRKALIGIVLMVTVVMGGILLFREEIEALSLGFVDIFGAFGVALGYYIPDAFTLPIPNDAVAFFGLAGGIPFWTVVAWGFVGSYLGGLTGFYIGRLLQKTRFFRAIMAKRGKEVEALMRKYGVWTLAAAALTPLPYSIACWACGAGNMTLKTFLLVSTLRLPKVAFYLYMIQLGLITVT